jgi:hypothetical protein
VSGFIFGESQLANVTGVTSKQFQMARKKFLKKGADWDMNGNHVAYSKNGLALVLLKLSFPGAEATAAANANLDEIEKRALLPGCSEEKKEVPPIIAIVSRFYLNRCILGVTIPGVGLVQMKVSATKNFKRLMVVPVRKNGDKWELTRKVPRFPGKW